MGPGSWAGHTGHRAGRQHGVRRRSVGRRRMAGHQGRGLPPPGVDRTPQGCTQSTQRRRRGARRRDRGRGAHRRDRGRVHRTHPRAARSHRSHGGLQGARLHTPSTHHHSQRGVGRRRDLGRRTHGRTLGPCPCPCLCPCHTGPCWGTDRRHRLPCYRRAAGSHTLPCYRKGLRVGRSPCHTLGRTRPCHNLALASTAAFSWSATAR